ncbi:DNA-directed RNA polymerase subunit beta' [candidate division WWE3 bacterium]|nr:DNA-directed RNA polymerase subunit beta' [candidate division WWE3 bacterium]
MKHLSNLRDFDALKIYLASSEEILSWSYGEVTKPETINYRTFKAVRGGLFDEKIFGPTTNFECYCGKYKGIRYKGVICDKCGVEVAHSRIRRERMGHISLAAPVVHVWFFRGIPSKLAYLLDVSPRKISSVIYFSSFIAISVDSEMRAKAISMVETDMQAAEKNHEESLERKIKETEKEFKEKAKTFKGDELKEEEHALKLKQRLQALRNKSLQDWEEQEQIFKLIRKKIEGIEKFSIVSDNEYMQMRRYVDTFADMQIGAEAIQTILQNMDLDSVALELEDKLEKSRSKTKSKKMARRLNVVQQFRNSEIDPANMVFEVLPVIPADLRPLVQLEGGRFASSDLNDLYRAIINRNNRLKKLMEIGAPEVILRNEKRMLQESVDAFIDSSKQRNQRRSRRGRKELRSLADMVKGKQGTFRLNLLGKRVDYSGRGVIVNGPKLKLNECGIPKEMALELFKPFVLRGIMDKELAPNIKSARRVLSERGAEVWETLEEVVEGHPVLLNRAPTLWRLGIQAFYPKLIEGDAIQLHLCVCSGYNADFDGDQMAVHLPLSEAAQEEARTTMLSTENLLNPSNGSPISVPNKIMLFGIYYMTSIDPTMELVEEPFANVEEALYNYEVSKLVELRQPIKVKMSGNIVETTVGRIRFNEIVPEEFGFINEDMPKKKVHDLLSDTFERFDHSVAVKLIDDVKDLGLKYGTYSGHSVSLSDIDIPEERDELIEKGRDAVAKIDKNFKRGLITKKEAQRLTEDTWIEITAEIDEAVWSNLSEENPVKVLVKSGSTRASRDQVKQIAGMRGLMTDPTGKIVPMPILGNYKNGLSGLEYFVGARGARKGLVDKGLKTADAGYLTRRLVDVSQDVIVREEDCGTEEGRVIEVGDSTVLQTFIERFEGRYLAQDVKDGRKKLASAGDLLTAEILKEIEDAGVEEIVIRSPMACKTRRGICAKCYGIDLMSRELVKIGTTVGVQAAQSIGEPGTQLTMRTFHTGGIAGKDITQGLPRVEEIVETRSPKTLSIMSEVTGTVKILETGEDRKIIVIPTDGKKEDAVEYMVDPVSEISVEDGQLVAKGDKLTVGHLDLEKLMDTVGVRYTQNYIVDQIQKVYASQGVSLNDKHIEVVVSKMFNNVEIKDGGDTDLMPGETVTTDTFAEKNEAIIAEGGEPAEGNRVLLGITKAALNTDSFLSAASFIYTSRVLTDAACSGKVDKLLGLKENVIIGNLIPTGERAKLEDE